MKNFPRTFKVFCIFLVFCFILVSISSGLRKGEDKGYWMDVVILPIASECAQKEVPNAVLWVDTTEAGCRGALIPFTSKSFYITFNHCVDYFEPFSLGEDIEIQKVEMGCQWHRKNGTYGVMFWLKDYENNYYRTEILELPIIPDPVYFSITVDDCLKVYPQTGGGKKKSVGYLTVGTIQFLEKIRQ